MHKGIYFAVTIPDRTESMLGISFIPTEHVRAFNEQTGEETEVEGATIFSIGLIILRIDIIF